MKCTWIVAGAFLLAVVVGCNEEKKSGGPGVEKDKGGGGTLTQRENTLSISGPTLSTKIRQGETKDVTIKITRGKNFDQDVKLTFGAVPKGVTIEPEAPMLKAGDKDITVKVKTADDAALGDHEITVHGKPTKEGPEAKDKFKITVEKKS
jgi:uncharacterized membrane protein